MARLTHAALFYYDMKELHPPEATEEEREEGRDNLKIHIHKWLTVTSNIGVPRYQGEKKENVVEWWEENAVKLPEISNLSKFLLDFPIQSAPCERLFKDFVPHLGVVASKIFEKPLT